MTKPDDGVIEETRIFTSEHVADFKLAEIEIKRVLDQKTVPVLEDIIDGAFCTTMNLVHYSGDREVQGQTEVLEFIYGLVVVESGELDWALRGRSYTLPNHRTKQTLGHLHDPPRYSVWRQLLCRIR